MVLVKDMHECRVVVVVLSLERGSRKRGEEVEIGGFGGGVGGMN
jgi:hypothetical protein